MYRDQKTKKKKPLMKVDWVRIADLIIALLKFAAEAMKKF